MKIIFKNKFNSNGSCLFCTYVPGTMSVCLNMCVCICTCVYVCVCVCMYIYSHTYIHACICKWIIDQHKFELHGSTYVNFFHQIHTAMLRDLNLIECVDMEN